MTKVLIIDDDARILRTFSRNLRATGYSVFSASGGADALAVYERERPDITLLDMYMPDMDGLEVLEAIRELDAGAEVLLTTGHILNDEVLSALRAGAADFVPKPINPTALESALRRAEERSYLREELRSTQQALEESEARHRAISELISDYAYAFDVQEDGTFELAWVTEAFTRITGYTGAETKLRAGWMELVHPEDLPAYQQRTTRLLEGHIDVSEFRIVSREDEVRWLRDYAQPMWDAAQGRVVRIVGAAQDITKRKQAEDALRRARDELEQRVRERTVALRTANDALRQEIRERRGVETQLRAALREKQAMMREIDHRVKNNLQILSSLLGFQADYAQDSGVASVMRESQNRVRSMALIHEKLYRAGNLSRIDFADYVQTLAADLYSTYSDVLRNVTFRLQVDVPQDLALDVGVAIPCGLIVNELVSNAFKYAFPPAWAHAGEASVAEISVSVRPAVEDAYTLCVSDNGVGLPADFVFPDETTLGLFLIEVFAEQLHGTVTWASEGGTTCCVTFAL